MSGSIPADMPRIPSGSCPAAVVAADEPLNAEPIFIYASTAGHPVVSPVTQGMLSGGGDVSYMTNPTDFWAEYTLAKKP